MLSVAGAQIIMDGILIVRNLLLVCYICIYIVDFGFFFLYQVHVAT